MKYRIVLIVIFIYSQSASAYDAYKCKDNDGNVIFSQTACIGIESEVIDVQPANGNDDPNRRSKSLTERAYKNKPSKLRRNKFIGENIENDISDSLSNRKLEEKIKCNRYREDIANAKTEMRSGYSSQRGEVLRARSRNAKKYIRKNCK